MTPPLSLDEAGARRPPSVTHFGLNAIAVVFALVVLYAIRTKILHVGDPVLALCAAFIVPVVLLDVLVLRVHRRETTGIDWDAASDPDWARVATKLLGLGVTLAPFALGYWLFPEYRLSAFYDPFFNLLHRFWPSLLGLAVVYVAALDGYMRAPEDTYWRLGRVVMGHWRAWDRKEIANHYRSWLIKAYFFALFWVWLTHSTYRILHYDLGSASWANLQAYEFAYDFIFFVDLLLATVGYAMTYRVIDTHIRSAEKAMLGWVAALFCYEPFFSNFERLYVHYGGNAFGSWLAPHPLIRWAWAGAIVLLILVYVLATVAFGVRFSNLTHRGIVTGGPYRFTKHPAYVAKNLSWWLASVPFVVSDGVPNAIRRSLLLGAMNFIYFVRARTEERHLSQDPAYVEYGLWMNRHGALRALGRIPFFRYEAPATEAGGAGSTAARVPSKAGSARLVA